MAFFQPTRARALSSRSESGFTLVEVALSIGIVAFAFVALLALLPAGNTAFRKSIDISVCGQIAQRVINDAQQAGFDAMVDTENADASDVDDEDYTFRYPDRKNPKGVLRYFDDQGREIIPTSEGNPTSVERQRIIYQVHTRIQPRAKVPRVRADRGTDVPSPEPMAQITVQVALNPGGAVDIPFSSAANPGKDPKRNLWDPTPAQAGIQIFTYAALVGRNE